MSWGSSALIDRSEENKCDRSFAGRALGLRGLRYFHRGVTEGFVLKTQQWENQSVTCGTLCPTARPLTSGRRSQTRSFYESRTLKSTRGVTCAPPTGTDERKSDFGSEKKVSDVDGHLILFSFF